MKQIDTSPDAYIASQAADIRAVLEELHVLIKAALPSWHCCMWEGIFWGGSRQRIIGYGSCSYLRADKKRVEWFIVGLARQKNYFSVYVNAVEAGKYLTEIYGAQLGKVKTGKSCINFRNLEGVDFGVLSKMVKHAGKLATNN